VGKENARKNDTVFVELLYRREVGYVGCLTRFSLGVSVTWNLGAGSPVVWLVAEDGCPREEKTQSAVGIP